MVIVLAHQAI
jgi:hypothetical protein